MRLPKLKYKSRLIYLHDLIVKALINKITINALMALKSFNRASCCTFQRVTPFSFLGMSEEAVIKKVDGDVRA